MHPIFKQLSFPKILAFIFLALKMESFQFWIIRFLSSKFSKTLNNCLKSFVYNLFSDSKWEKVCRNKSNDSWHFLSVLDNFWLPVVKQIMISIFPKQSELLWIGYCTCTFPMLLSWEYSWRRKKKYFHEICNPFVKTVKNVVNLRIYWFAKCWQRYNCIKQKFSCFSHLHINCFVQNFFCFFDVGVWSG